MSDEHDRLTELELLFMQQSRQFDELSNEVALCHRRIDELERASRAMQSMLQGMAPELEESPDE